MEKKINLEEFLKFPSYDKVVKKVNSKIKKSVFYLKNTFIHHLLIHLLLLLQIHLLSFFH